MDVDRGMTLCVCSKRYCRIIFIIFVFRPFLLYLAIFKIVLVAVHAERDQMGKIET